MQTYHIRRWEREWHIIKNNNFYSLKNQLGKEKLFWRGRPLYNLKDARRARNALNARIKRDYPAYKEDFFTKDFCRKVLKFIQKYPQCSYIKISSDGLSFAGTDFRPNTRARIYRNWDLVGMAVSRRWADWNMGKSHFNYQGR